MKNEFRNADDAIAFADKLKKKRPPKGDAAAGAGGAGAAQTPSAENSQTGSTLAAPQTPSQQQGGAPTPTPQQGYFSNASGQLSAGLGFWHARLVSCMLFFCFVHVYLTCM